MRDCHWPVQTITISASWDWSNSASGGTATAAIETTLTRKPFADFIAEAALQEGSSAAALHTLRARCQNASGFYGDNVPSLGSFIDQEPWIGAIGGGIDEYYGLAEGEFVIVHDYPTGPDPLGVGDYFCAPCQAYIIARPPSEMEEIGTYTIGEDTFPITGKLGRFQIFVPYQTPNMLAGFARSFDWPEELNPATKAEITVTVVEPGGNGTNACQTVIADPTDKTVAGLFVAHLELADGCVVALKGSNLHDTMISDDVEYDPNDYDSTIWKAAFRPIYPFSWTASFWVVSTPEGIAEPTSSDVYVTAESNGLRVQLAGRYAGQQASEAEVQINNTALGVHTLDPEFDYYAQTSGNAFSLVTWTLGGAPWGINAPTVLSTDQKCPANYSASDSGTIIGGPFDVETLSYEINVTWS